MGYSAFIDTVVCSDEVPEGRPYPYMIEQLMEKLHIRYPENVAKVGDTKVDIEEGAKRRLRHGSICNYRRVFKGAAYKISTGLHH